ncbi:MAG: tetratricopeptide repeat protein [Desulfuromonadales bacterium]|nr:tetratricopeptide repeat protein [Desulfuromonadales bacterium]
MRDTFRRCCLVMVLALFLSSAATVHAQLTSGQAAPVFALKDINGKLFDLAGVKQQPLTILYFFDITSRPSQEGLFSLNQLAKQHRGELVVWAVTPSSKEKVAQFASSAGLVFPILPSAAQATGLYHAQKVLPTVCIIGPGLRILDYFQGGGKATEAMLVRLAERELQGRRTRLAKAIGTEVVKKNPRSLKAKAVLGYAALRDADTRKAEEVFRDISKHDAEGEVLGKEGLAAVYKKQNQTGKALQMVRDVEKMAPERSYVHVIKGDILYAQNKKAEAESAYRMAVDKKIAEPYQDAVRYNQLGRFYAKSNKHKEAQKLYEKAVSIDPYYVEGTTNKGLSYEKEGKWDQALKAYQQALVVDKNDLYAGILAKRAQEMLALQKDTERKKRMDLLIKDLVARFKSQKDDKPAVDNWTSRPMILTFVDFEEKGGLSEREGFSTIITSELTSDLNSSGRVKVVERLLMERLLEELNLGSSELANPETSLKLGKVLAAKLIGTGSLYQLPQETVFSFRLIDTESSEIPLLTTKQLGPNVSLDKELYSLNREILKTVIAKYPLRGFLVKVTGDGAMINLGSRQGVVSGTRFDVVEEGETMEYKGKTLRSSPKTIGQVEVVRVDLDLAHVKFIQQQRPLKADDKIQERVHETATL